MIIYDVLAENEHEDVGAIRPDQSLRQAACVLMADNMGALAVTNEDEKLVGLISERELVQAVVTYDGDLREQPVSTLMTEPSVTCAPEEPIDSVILRMTSNAVMYAPVLRGERVMGVVSILELAQANELLRVRTNTDAVTGLANRACFVDNLVREIERCNRYGHALSVARLDIDGFEHMNEDYGRDAGNTVLRTLAQLFLDGIRNIDFVGRVGEGEFAVFFPETAMAGAEVACNRLSDQVRDLRIDIGGRQIEITVSIGLTEFGTKTAYSLDILNRADQLLGIAKTEGGDRLRTDPVLSAPKTHQMA